MRLLLINPRNPVVTTTDWKACWSQHRACLAALLRALASVGCWQRSAFPEVSTHEIEFGKRMDRLPIMVWNGEEDGRDPETQGQSNTRFSKIVATDVKKAMRAPVWSVTTTIAPRTTSTHCRVWPVSHRQS